MESLPDNLIASEILTRVPIRDAVRTSILSPAWRHRWKSISDLRFFEDNQFPVAAIDRVLLFHVGPIRSFTVYNAEMTVTDTDRWLLYLSLHHRHSLTHLELSFECGQQQHPPLDSSLFSFASLKFLFLYNCSISPVSNSSFPQLETLCLDNVSFPNEQCIHKFISNSPNLTSLYLVFVNPSPQNLVIANPNLREFHFCSPHCNSIVFSATQVLDNVRIFLYSNNQQFVLTGARCNGTLFLSKATCEALAKQNIPKSMYACFQNLIVLETYVDFTQAREISFLLSLMRSAPNLQKLKIQFRGKDEDGHFRLSHVFWKHHALCQLESLRIVELTFYWFVHTEIDFIIHVLERAKVLQKLVICNHSRSAAFSTSTLEMLRSFQSISPQLEIIYKET